MTTSVSLHVICKKCRKPMTVRKGVIGKTGQCEQCGLIKEIPDYLIIE